MARTLTEALARERMFVTAVTSGPMFRQDPEVFRALGSGVQRLRVPQPVRGRLDVTESSPANRLGQAAKRGKTRQASHRWKELHPAVTPEETNARRPQVYCWPKVYYRVEPAESSLKGTARFPSTSQPPTSARKVSDVYPDPGGTGRTRIGPRWIARRGGVGIGRAVTAAAAACGARPSRGSAAAAQRNSAGRRVDRSRARGHSPRGEATRGSRGSRPQTRSTTSRSQSRLTQPSAPGAASMAREHVERTLGDHPWSRCRKSRERLVVSLPTSGTPPAAPPACPAW